MRQEIDIDYQGDSATVRITSFDGSNREFYQASRVVPVPTDVQRDEAMGQLAIRQRSEPRGKQ
jgi:hypothetical protein